MSTRILAPWACFTKKLHYRVKCCNLSEMLTAEWTQNYAQPGCPLTSSSLPHPVPHEESQFRDFTDCCPGSSSVMTSWLWLPVLYRGPVSTWWTFVWLKAWHNFAWHRKPVTDCTVLFYYCTCSWASRGLCSFPGTLNDTVCNHAWGRMLSHETHGTPSLRD